MPFNQSGGGGAAGIGSSSLIYRFIVSGSTKASIDTGVDAAQAGSSSFANGDVLMVWLMGQTTEAATTSVVNLTFNNDTGANYDYQAVTGIGSTASASGNTAATALPLHLHGNAGTTGYPGSAALTVPGFSGTVFNKVGEIVYAVPDGTAANQMVNVRTFGYRSTSAVTRLKVIPASGSFAIGTALYIYNLTAS